MDNQINQPKTSSNRTLNSLLKIDSSIRNGQLVYAYRQVNKLLSDLYSGNHDVDPSVIEALAASVKRTVLLLKPFISSY
jgi:hypothetical protein